MTRRFGIVCFLAFSLASATAQDTAQHAADAHTGLPNTEMAWSMLSDNAAVGRSAHDRMDAMAALATMGKDERAAKLIGPAIIEHNSDVRIAAILAAGATENPTLIPQLKIALDDDNPQVAYTAALTLWKMHDTSGEDLLLAVATGDRKAKPGLLKSEKHKAAKDLHNPKTMSMLVLNQGSGYFLGPFGAGLKAIEVVNKNSGAPVRAADIDQLSRQHSEAVRQALIDDLTDPEPAVRAAAVKGLGNWPGEESAKQIYPLLGDTHLSVRLMAAAAYVRVSQTNAEPAPPVRGAP